MVITWTIDKDELLSLAKKRRVKGTGCVCMQEDHIQFVKHFIRSEEGGESLRLYLFNLDIIVQQHAECMSRNTHYSSLIILIFHHFIG